MNSVRVTVQMQTQRAVQCLHDVLAMMAALPPAVSCPSRASLTLCVSGQASPECGRVSPMQIDSWTHTHMHTCTATHSCSLLCPWLLLTKLAHFILRVSCLQTSSVSMLAKPLCIQVYVCKCSCLKTSIFAPQLSIHLILTQQPLPRHLPAWAWQQDHPVSWAALLSGSRRHPR
jgi:hypothetical protein